MPKFELNQKLKKAGDETIYMVSGISTDKQTYSIKGGSAGKAVVPWNEAEKTYTPASEAPSTGGTGGPARL